MEYFFRLEFPLISVCALCAIGIALLLRWKWYKPIQLRYALAGELVHAQKGTRHPFQKIFYLVHITVFCLLAFIAGKPQFVDSRSNVIVEGIDIVLALDASGSMQFQDYSDDNRNRFEVAKDEAIRFVKKRVHDSIGLVLFGKIALCRCLLTMDKAVLTELIEATKLGDIDPDATMLSTALLTAVNRLKNSQAKSKIVILLTDGEPSPGDIDHEAALAIAKKFGIKVYTIGIGSDSDEIMHHPLFGAIIQKPKVNSALLKKIASDTGGQFFMAHNDKDMRSIYDTIDSLERTKHESLLYCRYIDIYSWILIGILCAVFIQIIIATFIWFSL